MTPERLAELRMTGVAWCTESEFAALLDLVEAQRRALEIADRLAYSVGDLLTFFETRNEFYGERVEAAARRRLAAYDEARKETKP